MLAVEDLYESEEVEFTPLAIQQIMTARDRLMQLEQGHAASAATQSSGPAVASYVDEHGDWIIPAIAVDGHGGSYFSEKRIYVGKQVSDGNSIGALSKAFPTCAISFRVTPGDYAFDWHVAPARQLVVSLDAPVDIEVSSGERRVFPAGTVMLVADTVGRGHISRAVDGKPRHSLFITVPDDAFK